VHPDEERSTALQHEGGAPSVLSRIAATKAVLEQKFHLPIECVVQGWETQVT